MTTDRATAQENGLIGTVLAHPEAYHDCIAAGIRPDSFAHPYNARVWEIIEGMARDHKPITRYHVVRQIEADDHARAKSPLNEVFQLKSLLGEHGTPIEEYYAAQASRAFVPSFVAEIRKRHLARTIKRAAETALERVQSGHEPDDIAKDLQSDIAGQATTGLRIRTLADIRVDKVASWKANQGKGYVDIPCAFPELNTYLGGHRRRCVTVLGGYRGEGKSTLGRQFATHVASGGIPAGVITMEDSDEVAGAGVAGNLGNFSVYHLDTGTSDVTADEADKHWQAVESLPIYFADAPQTIESLISTMTALVIRNGCRFIVIDHIQYILPSGRHESRNVEVSRYSAQIAAATKRLDVSTMILSQLSRDAEKDNRKPRLSDLRDSGAIEQDARAALLLYRDDTGEHVLEIAKNNLGPSGKRMRLKRKDGRQRFECYGEI